MQKLKKFGFGEPNEYCETSKNRHVKQADQNQNIYHTVTQRKHCGVYACLPNTNKFAKLQMVQNKAKGRKMTAPHVTVNRDFWNSVAADWADLGESLWSRPAPVWGNCSSPESDLHLLPDDMTGMNAIELGCGTGYVSGWMHKRGATVTAIDVSANQLATARRLAAQHSADITFIHGNAEKTNLPDASFDFAISEYGAAIWCDPKVWLAEASRLLRPGGRLVFLGTHPLVILSTPESGALSERKLFRSYRTLHATDWTQAEIEPGGIEFGAPMSGWFDLFSENGFSVLNYQELYAPAGFDTSRMGISTDWAKDFPIEHIWHLEKSR